MVKFGGHNLNGFTPNLTGRISNSTRHEILVKLGGNSLRLHCMPAWSNWVSSLWIYTQFDQYFMPGQIQPVEFQI